MPKGEALSLYDIDYGIEFLVPSGWEFRRMVYSPIRYAINPSRNIAIVATVLELDLVEKGLRAISRWLIENVFNYSGKDARVLYNIEGNLVREFGVVVDNYYVRGILELVKISTYNGDYSEYFVKCVISKDKEVRELDSFLDQIKKVSAGIPVSSPLRRIEYPYDSYWSVYMPYPTIYIPDIWGVRGLIGTVSFNVSINIGILEGIPEYLQKQLAFISSLNGIYQYSVKETKSTDFEGYIIAHSNDNRVLEVFVRRILPKETNAVVVFGFCYPFSATFGAKKFIDAILKTWKISPKLIEDLTYVPMTSQPITYQPETITTVRETSQTKRITSKITTEKKKDRNCLSKKRALLREIDTIKTQIRLLEQDYKTRLETLETIKTSDVITGMYTFENPVGKTRFVHTKTRSPIVGDRFWEHKDVVYLENKTYVVTRHITPPRHQFRELKWKVEQQKKRLNEEYKKKKRELEQKLRKLEAELRKLNC